MKSQIRSFGLCIGSFVCCAQAQATLVAGWDFSQFFGTGANSVDGATFNGAGNVEANFSDFFDPSPDIASSIFGSIYYDGSFGSTDITPAQFNASTAPATGNLESSKVQSTDGFPFNESLNNLVNSGQLYRQDLSLGIQADSSIVFEADLSSVSETGAGWYLEFAAKDLNSGDSSTISWEVSTDGASYSALSATTITSSLDTSYVVNDEGALAGASKVYFKGTITGIDTQLLIDNVGIHTGAVQTWAGFTIDENGFADTNGWLGFVNVNLAPWYYNFNLDTFMYIPAEPTVGAGFWAYVIKNGATANAGSFWGGYAEDSSGNGWINGENWLGFFNVSLAPYLYVFGNVDDRGGINAFVYAQEPSAGFNGTWVYVFPPLD